MRERTVLGPTGLDQFFLSQNVQFSAYILYVQHYILNFHRIEGIKCTIFFEIPYFFSKHVPSEALIK